MKRRLLVVLAIVAPVRRSTRRAPARRPEAAVNTVKAFYRHLLSTHPATTCPKLFDDPKTFIEGLPNHYGRGNADKSLATWTYLRQHKDLFVFWAVQTDQQVDALRF